MSAATVAGSRHRRYRPVGELDLHLTLAPHMRGRYDLCHRVDSQGAHWRTWRTPDGPVTLRLCADRAAGEIDVQAWGSGSAWALDGIPALLGSDDDWSALTFTNRLLHETRRRCIGMRLSRSNCVVEALVPAVIEQLVNGVEARRTWNGLLARFGEVAPGPIPFDLRVFPDGATLRQISTWEWHRLGLDGRRRQTVIGVAQVVSRIDQFRSLDIETSARRLASLPGIGEWTVAETLQRSHGSADLVSVGDYHVPNMVGYLFAGRPRSTDDEMLELLEPYRPHRQRVVRLVEATGVGAPRYGPRIAVRDYRRM
ncbi:MAG: DNA-3-methyladenine glycosylase family protein [Acidothermaceae bacterium]